MKRFVSVFPAAAGVTLVGWIGWGGAESLEQGRVSFHLWQAMLLYPFAFTLAGLLVVTLPLSFLVPASLGRSTWILLIAAAGGVAGGFFLDAVLQGEIRFWWIGALYGAAASMIWAYFVWRSIYATLGASHG